MRLVVCLLVLGCALGGVHGDRANDWKDIFADQCPAGGHGLTPLPRPVKLVSNNNDSVSKIIKPAPMQAPKLTIAPPGRMFIDAPITRGSRVRLGMLLNRPMHVNQDSRANQERATATQVSAVRQQFEAAQAEAERQRKRAERRARRREERRRRKKAEREARRKARKEAKRKARKEARRGHKKQERKRHRQQKKGHKMSGKQSAQQEVARPQHNNKRRFRFDLPFEHQTKGNRPVNDNKPGARIGESLPRRHPSHPTKDTHPVNENTNPVNDNKPPRFKLGENLLRKQPARQTKDTNTVDENKPPRFKIGETLLRKQSAHQTKDTNRVDENKPPRFRIGEALPRKKQSHRTKDANPVNDDKPRYKIGETLLRKQPVHQTKDASPLGARPARNNKAGDTMAPMERISLAGKTHP